MNIHKTIPLVDDTDIRLSIDKLSLTYSFSDRSKAYALAHYLEQVCEDGNFKGVLVKSARRHRYQISVPILFGEAYLPDHVLIDLVARHAGISDLRLDFNPKKVGAEGIQ